MAVQIRISALNTVLQENVAGLKVVRAFGREAEEQVRFSRSAGALLEQQLKVGRAFSFLFPVVFLIANLGQAAVLYFGGRQIIGETLTVGEWQKFSLYLAYLFMPLGQLGFIINLMSQASASAQRIFESSIRPTISRTSRARSSCARCVVESASRTLRSAISKPASRC